MTSTEGLPLSKGPMKSKTEVLKKSKILPKNGRCLLIMGDRYLPKIKIPCKKKWKALMLIRHQVPL
jgi:hypothetical protein